MVRSLVEALVVVALGAAVGLGVNASRGDRGLVISRDHFATKIINPPPVSDGEHDEGSGGNAENGRDDAGAGGVESASDAVDPTDDTASDEWKGLVAAGYQPIRHEQVVADFQSPEYSTEQIVFVDARDDAHYKAGHLAGAYQLDHYLVDNYIDTVLPACLNATKVIVYCNGGECEDSMFAAGDLIERGVNPTKVYVYVGGVAAWKRDGLPFERGERYSGDEVYLNE